jgi:hypothetical protein
MHENDRRPIRGASIVIRHREGARPDGSQGLEGVHRREAATAPGFLLVPCATTLRRLRNPVCCQDRGRLGGAARADAPPTSAGQRIVRHHAVAAGLLGQVQRAVRAIDQRR